MGIEYLTENEWKSREEIVRASRLKEIILGRGDHTLLLNLFSESIGMGNIFSKIIGRNERIVSTDELVNYLVQAGYAENSDKAREEVLPTMDGRLMEYKRKSFMFGILPKRTPQIGIRKVEDKAGRKVYKVVRV